MTIYFLSFHCNPKDGTSDFYEFGGAYINCWIHAEDKDSAINISKHKITELDWNIIELEECYIITEKDYLNSSNNSGLQYYRQALIDKWVIVMHTYPIEDEQ